MAVGVRTRHATRMHTRSVPGASAGVGPTVIPFDYAATFELSGTPGNLIQDVINFDVDSVFVATAIGYGLEDLRLKSLPLSSPPVSSAPGSLTLPTIPQSALIQGFRVNQRFLATVFNNVPMQPNQVFDATALEFSTDAVPRAILNNVFQQAQSVPDLSFLFSMVDTNSGRELQDEPTHNLASLGISNGERPFRMLARPVYFMPRSTMRLQIQELSEGVQGTLFIVIYGYKVLSTGCPENVVRQIQGTPFCRTETIGNPTDRIIPFDYVTKFLLTGQYANEVEDEIAINVEGGFVATHIGYGLATEDDSVTLDVATDNPVDLTAITLNQFPPDALVDGVQLRPDYLRFAFDTSGNLNNALPGDLANEIFRRANRPEDVSFRYTILDGGTGRELQNQPIHNLAGLGIANGKRPFKQLIRPMVFLPRSTLRVRVYERFGRGELYIVFQGFKILNAAAVGVP
jgi:hypothetical protein